MSTPTWRPLLAGSLADEASSSIDSIAQALLEPFDTWPLTGLDDGDGVRSLSLASGRSGAALFLAYLARASGRAEYERASQALLDEAIELLAHRSPDASLFCGFAGIAWVVQHLQAPKLDSEDDPNLEIDEVLVNLVEKAPWHGAIDLVDGLAGITLYLLDRHPRSSAVRGVESALTRLAELGQERGGGLTWPRQVESNGGENQLSESFNLGLSHGIPGVVGVLSMVHRSGTATETAATLLDSALRWLMAIESQDGWAVSFPHFWPLRGENPTYRSAWCYGDPGVAAAVLQAARALGREEVEAAALRIALRAARFPAGDSGVVDAGLCHGAAGLGHVFQRLYRSTKDETFADAARYWFGRALALRVPGGRIGGFRAWCHEEDRNGAWADDPSFLTGASGIGLALLAATTDIEPRWDRAMLLDLPERTR